MPALRRHEEEIILHENVRKGGFKPVGRCPEFNLSTTVFHALAFRLKIKDSASLASNSIL